MSKMWFKPKIYGFGAGPPIAWQGWVVLVVYVASLGASFAYAATHYAGVQQTVFKLACAFVLTVLLIAIVAIKTEGGWRWRWGDRDR